tara:strand:- start:3601 stop:3948 length:348 start_codon:yes stop_codon:yes gene_type:complete
MKMTEQDVVRAVASKYTIDTRSLNEDCECAYNGEFGEHCAVAMFVREDKVAEMSEDMSPNDVILHDLLRSDVKHINKPQFWDAVQRLHDQEVNWNVSGLSCSGKSFVMEEFGLTL